MGLVVVFFLSDVAFGLQVDHLLELGVFDLVVELLLVSFVQHELYAFEFV